MTRAETIRAIEEDVRLVLDGAGGANAAMGRLLARLAAGTAVENAETLRDVLTAAEVALMRAVENAETLRDVLTAAEVALMRAFHSGKGG